MPGAGGKRHFRGRALCPTSVIPADAGIQRKTKHATTPFATRRGRERANRCERGMPRAAGVNVIPADAGTQRKTKHATTPFVTRRGRERANRCERGMPGAAGVNVIPADAGIQRKTKHATPPFATRRGRERAKRCERGMPGAAGGKRHSRGGTAWSCDSMYPSSNVLNIGGARPGPARWRTGCGEGLGGTLSWRRYAGRLGRGGPALVARGPEGVSAAADGERPARRSDPQLEQRLNNDLSWPWASACGTGRRTTRRSAASGTRWSRRA